jgi:acetaldehyde dehydrogenase
MKRIAVLGTGNIGTDLLVKLHKLGYENIAFIGRREDSEGIQKAKSLGIQTSTDGINFFSNNKNFDVVFDCTNAFDAIHHYEILKKLDIKVIDLTPAKIGEICVPCINGKDINDIIKLASDLGLDIGIITNSEKLSRLNPDLYDKINCTILFR